MEVIESPSRAGISVVMVSLLSQTEKEACIHAADFSTSQACDQSPTVIPRRNNPCKFPSVASR